MQRIKKKIKSRQGFTLVEMLVALLLLGFMMLVVGSGSTVALDTYREGIRYAESATLSSTVQSSVENEMRYAYNIVTAGDQVTSFSSKNYGENTKFLLDANGMVQVESDSGSVPLLGTKVYTNELSLKELKISMKDAPSVPYGKIVEIYIEMSDETAVTSNVLNVNYKE